MAKLTLNRLLSPQPFTRRDKNMGVVIPCDSGKNNDFGFDVLRVKTLHNPYTLNISEKRLNRFLVKLNTLIDLIERDYYLDQDHFQLLLESHWLHTNARGGMLVLPNWELYIFSALNSSSVMKDPETRKALLAVAAELRLS